MTKLLAWSDYCTYTGFSIMISNILRRLDPMDFDIDVVAINFGGDPDYDETRFPGRAFPAKSGTVELGSPFNDQLGRQKLLDRLRENDYDTLFIVQDLPIMAEFTKYLLELRRKYDKKFKIVYYFPVDVVQDAFQGDWVLDSIAKFEKDRGDIAVGYTKFAAACANSYLQSDTVKHVPHGIDLTEFYPLPVTSELKEARKVMFRQYSDKFIITNVNRNQPRKDIPRSLMVLKYLKRHKFDAIMYLHMSNEDIGGDLDQIARQLDLIRGRDYFMPTNLDPFKGLPSETLNMIYNVSDVVITTSLGEGWGLSITEAMAAQIPVVAPNHTSFYEIIKGSRGYLVEAGRDSSAWTMIANDIPVLRPQVDVELMAIAIQDLKRDGPGRRIQNAYDWVVKELDWDFLVANYWREYLK